MKSWNGFVVAAAAALLFVSGGAYASDTGNAEAAIKVVEQFHAALKEGNATGASALLASTAVIYESGYAESRDDYVSHHLAADIEFAKGTQSVVKSTKQECVESLCVVMQTSETMGKFKGKDVRSTGVETTVLRRDGDTWKIHHVHWSSHK